MHGVGDGFGTKYGRGVGVVVGTGVGVAVGLGVGEGVAADSGETALLVGVGDCPICGVLSFAHPANRKQIIIANKKIFLFTLLPLFPR